MPLEVRVQRVAIKIRLCMIFIDLIFFQCSFSPTCSIKTVKNAKIFTFSANTCRCRNRDRRKYDLRRGCDECSGNSAGL